MNKIDLINSWSSSNRTSLTSELQDIIEGKYPKDLDIDFRITPDYFSFYAEVIDNLNSPQKDNVISILNNLLGSYSTYEKISSEKQRLNDFRISSIFNLVKYINTDNNEYISSSILKTIINDYLSFSEEIYLHAAFTLSTYNVSSKEKKQYWLELGENPVFFVPTFNALSDLPDDCLDYLLDYFKKTEQLSLTDFEKFENILETTCIHLTEKILLFCGEEEKKFIFYLRKIFRVQNFLKGKIISFLKFYLETVDSALLHYLKAYEVFHEFIKDRYYETNTINCDLYGFYSPFYDTSIIPGFINYYKIWKLFGLCYSSKEKSSLTVVEEFEGDYLDTRHYLTKKNRNNSNNEKRDLFLLPFPIEGLEEEIRNASTDVGILNKFDYPILSNRSIEELEKEFDLDGISEKFKKLLSASLYSNEQTNEYISSATYKLWIILASLSIKKLPLWVNDDGVEEKFRKVIPRLKEYFEKLHLWDFSGKITIKNINEKRMADFENFTSQQLIFTDYQNSSEPFFFVGTAPLYTEVTAENPNHYLFSISDVYNSFCSHDEEKYFTLPTFSFDKNSEDFYKKINNVLKIKAHVLNELDNCLLNQCLNININLSRSLDRDNDNKIVYRLFKLTYFLSKDLENSSDSMNKYINYIVENYWLFSIGKVKTPSKDIIKESVLRCFKFGITNYYPNRSSGSNSWDIYNYLIEEKNKILKKISIEAEKIEGDKNKFAKALSSVLEIELGENSTEYLLLNIVPSEIRDFFTVR